MIINNIKHLIGECGIVYVRRHLMDLFPAHTVRECRTKKHNFVAHTWDELGNMIAVNRAGQFVQLFPHDPGYIK